MYMIHDRSSGVGGFGSISPFAALPFSIISSVEYISRSGLISFSLATASAASLYNLPSSLLSLGSIGSAWIMYFRFGAFCTALYNLLSKALSTNIALVSVCTIEWINPFSPSVSYAVTTGMACDCVAKNVFIHLCDVEAKRCTLSSE